MKAKIFDHDRLRLSTEGIEIGFIPKDRGIESYRWDGKSLVDMLAMGAFYVDSNLVLHSIPIPGSQLVTMKYQDKKKLWNDNGTYKIKSDEQVRTELNLQYRRSHYPSISDQVGVIMKYLETQPNLSDELGAIMQDINDVKAKYPT